MGIKTEFSPGKTSGSFSLSGPCFGFMVLSVIKSKNYYEIRQEPGSWGIPSDGDVDTK